MKRFSEFTKKKKPPKGWKKETIEISISCSCFHERDLIGEAKYTRPDVKAMYQDFNRRYYKGALPTNLKVRWGNAGKGRTGVTKATYFTKKEGGKKYYMLNEIKSITISNNYNLTPERTEVILLHEMAHAKNFSDNIFVTTGQPPGHGLEFVKEIRYLEGLHGKEIPLTDSEVNTYEISDSAKKTYGIVLRRTGRGQWVFNLFSKNGWNPETANQWLENHSRVLNRYYSVIYVGMLHDSDGSMVNTPTNRNPKTPSSLYKTMNRGYQASDDEAESWISRMSPVFQHEPYNVVSLDDLESDLKATGF